jgi:hypothetical protein
MPGRYAWFLGGDHESCQQRERGSRDGSPGIWRRCGCLGRGRLERDLEAELTAHLGHERYDRGGAENARNGAIAREL